MKLKFVRVGRRHLRRLNEIVNDREVCRFLTLVPPVSMKSTLEWYKHTRKMKNCWWAMIYDGMIIGSVNLMRKA
jgi:hypothetical protein